MIIAAATNDRLGKDDRERKAIGNQQSTGIAATIPRLINSLVTSGGTSCSGKPDRARRRDIARANARGSGQLPNGARLQTGRLSYIEILRLPVVYHQRRGRLLRLELELLRQRHADALGLQ